MMSPVGLSLVLQTYSHEERSRIMGLMFAPSFLAMVVAPFLGGIIMSYASWPWIFYVNIPVGLATLWVIHRHVKNPSHKRLAGRFDTAGFVTSSVGMGALFAGLSRAGEQARPDAVSFLLMATGLASLILFLWIESSRAHPLINVRIFLEPLFAAGTLVQFILISAVNGSLFAFTMWQQQVLGRSPFVTGLLCAVQAMAYVGTVVFASRLSRIWSERRLVLWGHRRFHRERFVAAERPCDARRALDHRHPAAARCRYGAVPARVMEPSLQIDPLRAHGSCQRFHERYDTARLRIRHGHHGRAFELEPRRPLADERTSLVQTRFCGECALGPGGGRRRADAYSPAFGYRAQFAHRLIARRLGRRLDGIFLPKPARTA